MTYAEHVIVNTSISVHSRRGDVELRLHSPQNTESVLLPKRRSDYITKDISNWPFMTVASWGEDPRGKWSMTIHGSVTVSRLELLVFGTADTPVAMKRIPRDQCSPQCQGGCSQKGAAEFCDNCLHYRVKSTRECVEKCPEGTYAKDAVCWPCASVCLTCTGEGEAACSSCSSAASLVGGICIADKLPVNRTTALDERVLPALAVHIAAPKISTQQLESSSLSFELETSQDTVPESTPSLPGVASPPLDTQHIPLPSSAVAFNPLPSKSSSQPVEEVTHVVATSGEPFSPPASETPPPAAITTSSPPIVTIGSTQAPSCEEGCAHCSTPLICSVCKPGLLLFGLKCVSRCSVGFTAVEGRCIHCSVPHCSQCEVATKCDTCEDGFYLSSYGVCQHCDEGCVRCSGQGECLECSEGAVQCVEIVASEDHRYSTFVGVAVVGACLVVLVVTGVLIGLIFCKHKHRGAGGRSSKKLKYQPVQGGGESDSEGELLYQR